MVRLVSALLVLAYLFALVMSAGHLSEWYRLTLGSLPSWFAIGLATALEASAFLLSLLSNSILKASRWANWGALVALALVWVGNYMSMLRAANGIPAYEVFLSSLFVPVSTYVVAKVLGELQTLGAEGSRVSRGEPKRASLEVSKGEPVYPEGSRVNPKVSLEVSPINPKVSSKVSEVSPVNPGVYPREPQGVSKVSEVSSRCSPCGEATRCSPCGEATLGVNSAVSWKPDPTGRASLNGTLKVSQGGYARYLGLLDAPRTLTELPRLAEVSKPAARKALQFLEERGLVEAREGRWVRKGAYPVNGKPPSPGGGA